MPWLGTYACHFHGNQSLQQCRRWPWWWCWRVDLAGGQAATAGMQGLASFRRRSPDPGATLSSVRQVRASHPPFISFFTFKKYFLLQFLVFVSIIMKIMMMLYGDIEDLLDGDFWLSKHKMSMNFKKSPMTRVSSPQNIRSFRSFQREHCQRCAGFMIHVVTIQLSSIAETKNLKF